MVDFLHSPALVHHEPELSPLPVRGVGICRVNCRGEDAGSQRFRE